MLFSRSDHCTKRGLPPAPRHIRNLSSVTRIARLFTGAFATTAAFVPVLNCHSYTLPSVLEQATRNCPNESIDHVVAGVIVTDSCRAVP